MLKSRFCAKCGKASKASLCAECFLEEHPISVPKKVSVRFCTKCKAIWLGGIWVKASKPIEDYLLNKIIDKIKLPESIELEKAKIIKDKLKVTLKFGKSKLTKEYEPQMVIEKYCCPECSRETSTNYLAIIQLRTNKDVVSFVKQASALIKKKAKIIKAKEHKKGIDYYLANKDTAKSLATKIKNKLKCKIKYSEKQFGWDRLRHKPLTKLTVLVKEK